MEPGMRRDGGWARLWEVATPRLGEGGARVGGVHPPGKLLVKKGPVPQEQAMRSWLWLVCPARLTEHPSWGRIPPCSPFQEGQPSSPTYRKPPSASLPVLVSAGAWGGDAASPLVSSTGAGAGRAYLLNMVVLEAQGCMGKCLDVQVAHGKC